TSRQTKNLNKLLIRILLHLQVEFSVYKKGVAAKRKICRGIFFSFGCTMGPECFTKFGKRFSLVH
ncbi:hypothetical protein AAH069_27000, partial [Bacteroides thetaiotaomicron]